MSVSILRRSLIATTAVLSLTLATGAALAADKVKLRFLARIGKRRASHRANHNFCARRVRVCRIHTSLERVTV